MTVEHVETIVIGGGQAGLAVGYHLAQRGLTFLIVDAHERIGDAWRRRWDSLRLFTPAEFDQLPGMPFPARTGTFPTKDEMADYLESYAARFQLPVRNGVRVDRLTRHEGRFLLAAGARRFTADNVVVAMSAWQHPRVPAFARDLDAGITQFHSLEYRRPSQLREGDVLVVGAGNSGAEIAIDAARGRRVWLAGRVTGHIPFAIDGLVGRLFARRLVLRGLFHHLLTIKTPFGRIARRRFLRQGMPLIRLRPQDLAAANITRVPRMIGVRDGRPLLEDGRVLDVTNVVWCTGFNAGLSWIDLPIVQNGEPRHERGVGVEPGVYFVGLGFIYAASSVMVQGVGRDAAHVVKHIAGRRRQIGNRPPALHASRVRRSFSTIERALMIGLGLMAARSD
jgi:putative flavoprotein involved in K+ transport